MLIKSGATGEMVLGRPLMICFALGKVFTIKACVSSDDDWIVMDDGSYIEPSDCTLLHCPFQVGDEYEVYREGLCGFEDKWFGGQIFDSQEDAELANSGKFMMQRRHADPSLRNSPDYVL
jgi:hypothetical protein